MNTRLKVGPQPTTRANAFSVMKQWRKSATGGNPTSLTENRPLTIIQATLDHLEIDEGNVKEFELEYELEGDMERSIELEVDRMITMTSPYR